MREKTITLITGMSGTGKSSVIGELRRRGYRAVDTDSDEWCQWAIAADGRRDWIWREEAMLKLIKDHRQGRLYIAGCKSNQGKFYRYFDNIVLLSAPEAVMLERIAGRTGNPYGKSPEERAMILRDLEEVEPLLRAGATEEIVTTAPIHEVVGRIVALG